MAENVWGGHGHGANGTGSPEVNVGTADAGGFYGDGYFTFFQILALLDGFDIWATLGDPKVMLRISEDTYVGFGDCFGLGSVCSGHLGLFLGPGRIFR